jgi:hypothetical protein
LFQGVCKGGEEGLGDMVCFGGVAKEQGQLQHADFRHDFAQTKATEGASMQLIDADLA